MTVAEPSGCVEFDRALELLDDQREDEALDWFEVATDATDDAAVKASASAFVAALLLGFQRPWEVAEFTGRLRQSGGSAALADMLDASACIQLGDATGALQLLGEDGPVAVPSDRWYPCSGASVHAARVRALHVAGRNADARRALDAALTFAPNEPPVWEAAVHLVADGAVDATDVLVHLGSDQVVSVFGWIAGAPTVGLDRMAEAVWAQRPNDPVTLAAATLFAWRLDAAAALRWSVRLAEAGVTARSPILERAERPAIAAGERVRAAVVGAPLDTPRARVALEAALAGVADAELLDLFDACVEHAGSIVDSFVVAAATSTARCLILAGELVRRGHDAEGFAVLVAGLSLPTADALTREAFDALLPVRERRALARVAHLRGDETVAAILASVAAPGA